MFTSEALLGVAMAAAFCVARAWTRACKIRLCAVKNWKRPSPVGQYLRVEGGEGSSVVSIKLLSTFHQQGFMPSERAVEVQPQSTVSLPSPLSPPSVDGEADIVDSIATQSSYRPAHQQLTCDRERGLSAGPLTVTSYGAGPVFSTASKPPV